MIFRSLTPYLLVGLCTFSVAEAGFWKKIPNPFASKQEEGYIKPDEPKILKVYFYEDDPIFLSSELQTAYKEVFASLEIPEDQHKEILIADIKVVRRFLADGINKIESPESPYLDLFFYFDQLEAAAYTKHKTFEEIPFNDMPVAHALKEACDLLLKQKQS